MLIEVSTDPSCSLPASPPVGDGPANGKRRANFGYASWQSLSKYLNSFHNWNLCDGVSRPYSTVGSALCPETEQPLQHLSAASGTFRSTIVKA
jgi:hypothetical protein